MKLKELSSTVFRAFVRKIPMFLTVAAVVVVMGLTTGCPIKFLSGVPCPGCGMTRAVGALLRFDIKSAVHYHPLVLILPLFGAYIVVSDIIPPRVSNAIIVTFGALFLGVYIFRLFFTENPVMAIDFDSGFVVQSIRHIKSIFGGLS